MKSLKTAKLVAVCIVALALATMGQYAAAQVSKVKQTDIPTTHQPLR